MMGVMLVTSVLPGRFQIGLRRGIIFGYRCRLAVTLQRNKKAAVRSVLYYPRVDNADVLCDLANRAAWYLPLSDYARVSVSIPVHPQLLHLDPRDLEPPAVQDNYIKDATHVRLVDERQISLAAFDRIMIWDSRALYDRRVWPFIGRVRIVDPQYYSTIESTAYYVICAEAVTENARKELMSLSVKNYNALLERIKGLNKAFVFGTGPSLEQAGKFDYNRGFRVVCNSIVKNKELLKHIKPHLLVFADSVFHFSPCLYAAEFRRHVSETVNNFDCYVMIPERYLPYYLAHYPHLRQRIIGMPIRRFTIKLSIKEFNFPTPECFFVRLSHNILTLFMLPVASSVADEVYIIGADGRKPGENYFWQHSPTAQYGDLMQTVFETHPSFFRDRNYAGYYQAHCRFLAGLLRYGESLGKKYYTLTPSLIPALAQRSVLEVGDA